MKALYGTIASAFLAASLSGCGGSAAPAAPFVHPVTGADDVHVVVIDDARGDNSYPHILVKALAPANLAKPVKDGQSLTLVVSAEDSKNRPVSLAGASISWSKPVHGTLVAEPGTPEAVYNAPRSGTGSDMVAVTVVFAEMPGRVSTMASIKFQSH